MTETISKKPKEKKYRYTKQLLKLAIENGYTNKEIALKAGMSDKSIAQVSRWKAGQALATERQMQFFINEFGDQLKRKMEHLLYKTVSTEQDGIPTKKFNYFKVSGEIILKHTIRKKSKYKNNNEAIYRILVIQNENVFYTFEQYRGEEFPLKKYSLSKALMFNSYSENAIWLTRNTNKSLNHEEFIGHIDNLSESYINNVIDDEESLKDVITLPFIAREKLLKNGYTNKDIEVFE